MWVHELSLQTLDRDAVRQGWLNDRIMDAVNKLIGRELGSGMQSTLMSSCPAHRKPTAKSSQQRSPRSWSAVRVYLSAGTVGHRVHAYAPGTLAGDARDDAVSAQFSSTYAATSQSHQRCHRRTWCNCNCDS